VSRLEEIIYSGARGGGKTIAARALGEIARQKETFLAQHADKAETHVLCEYPRNEPSPMSRVPDYGFSQVIALVPKDDTEPGPPELLDEKGYPWVKIEFDLLTI
jgi:hypothetical protein